MLSWDNYSDQPHIIKDKSFKREIYKKSLFDTLKLLFTNLILSPFIFINYLFFKKEANIDDDIFCLGISKENKTPNTIKRVKELGVKKLLIRFPLSKMQKLHEYKEFINEFSEYDILINLVQDRAHVEDLELLKRDLRVVFSEFKGVKEYQIGTTINRKKWAFFIVDEYLKFFEVAKSLRDSEFKDISLIGSSVIDFEYHFSIRSLFNFYDVFYDRFSSLLYVDRRGSPFNTQLGFNLLKKINLLYSIMSLSPKTNNILYITETNWPISSTAPYAPTSEKECVDLQTYAEYMVAYYLLSIVSKQVSRVYWHQLDAKGYGLIDQTTDREYPSFLAYKVMVKYLQNKKMLQYNIKENIKSFIFEDIKVCYCESGFKKEFIKKGDEDIYGKSYESGKVLYRWMTC